jgi:ferritin-like protein
VNDLTLENLDQDGALREALDGLHCYSRADLLRKAAIGSGALLAAFAAPATAGATPRRDMAILNYALTLEYLQEAFYTEVERIGALRGELAHQARVVGGHERAHVKAFLNVLGGGAVKRPFFNFRGVTEDADKFRKTAVAFEDLAVAAYKGQAPRLISGPFLVAALGIHAVEARHAAWIRRLAGFVPAATAFDEPISMQRTLQIVGSTHFIVKTRSKGSPRFTG